MNTTAPRRILVTSALPYANGPIHIGHLVEYIQTDIWVRFQQLRGHECHYVCADDAHGTPIMLRAEKEGLTPQTLIDKSHAEHQADFQGFLVNHHQFHTTHSAENQHYTGKIYQSLDEQGYILTKVIEQAYDVEKQMFLPDRFIKGTCPKCKSKDQYGDNCEVCGATYAPTELLEPYSVLSGASPELRDSEHYFFDLPQFEAFLKGWLNDQDVNLQTSMRNKLAEWFESGLKAWDISRDAPYWGFEIPGKKDKYFYVWLDAPVGYMASFQALCDREGLDFEAFWGADSDAELYHFIGKDIAYFHMLFWPAMLKGAGYRTPTGVFCHGFLTVNGEKMSKSRGTFIQAATYLRHLRPEYLRYYYAAKLSSRVEDIDLSMDDFKNRVNSDLVGKLVNLASRCAPFIIKHFDGQLSDALPENHLFVDFAARGEKIAQYYEQREYAQAMREIMQLADAANEYIDAEKPWVKIKDEASKADVQAIATVGLNAFRQLMVYLKPVLPQVAADAEAFLHIEPLTWADATQPLLDHRIGKFKPLMQRIEDKDIDAIIADSKEDLRAENTMQTANEQPVENQEDWITIDDFAKLDLRIAKVLSCEPVEGADKLLQFTLDVGELGQRQVFSGIKKFHAPEELDGQLVVYIANLKPRKMRFGLSEGMILSASDDETLQILLQGGRAKAGMKIS
ncbi:methionine--tRNA ligase [Suttonella sp. R2A3]|uniref:methionine--tRNA ligase n=1 Tax=Suttonella sp. R2A3 TaxID=2908648 RepID=UPI001F3754FB|nr:methionine--tRNA ligase [Suttonella sp. R2A3]UJF25013.1 methionine--tRNA ligase [Suttonella sp. R2A3]